MANNFIVSASSRTTQVLNATTALEVYEIQVKTIPEGVEFTYIFPYASWIAAGGAEAMEAVVAPVVSDVQAILAHQYVTGAYGSQDQNANGLFVPMLTVILEIPGTSVARPGPFETTVDIPIEILGNSEFRQFTYQAKLDAAVARLQQTIAI